MPAQARAESADKPLLYWIGTGLCVFLTLLCVMMLLLFLNSGDDEILRATASGQRITIDKNGTVSGTVQSSASHDEKSAALTNEKDQPTDKPESDKPAFDVGPEEGTAVDVTATTETSPTDKSDLIASEEDAVTSIRVYPRSATSLSEAPAEGLSVKTEWGILPKTGSIGSVSRYYARPATDGVKQPVVAIIVTGLGQNKSATEKALELPLDISLSFDPYAKNTPLWTESARNLGHEAWLMLPAQPKDFPASDPGPKSLLNDLKVEDNLVRMRQTLSSFSGYVGTILPANQVFTDSDENFAAVSAELKKRGVALLASTKPTASKAYSWFKKNKKMGLLANEVIDEKLSANAIVARLKALESKANTNGKAIGIIHAYPISMQMVEEWSKTLASKGITLVPTSSLLDM